MIRHLLVCLAFLFAVEITIPDAAADEYHDLGCYVGNMTRAEFYAAKDRQHEAFDAEQYRVEEARRIERNAKRWAALKPQKPCPFQVGDRVRDVSLVGAKRNISLYGDAIFTVKEVFYDGRSAWRLRSESAEHGTRDLHAENCKSAVTTKVTDAKLPDAHWLNGGPLVTQQDWNSSLDGLTRVLDFAIEEAKGGQPEMLRDILQGWGCSPEQIEIAIARLESTGADEREQARKAKRQAEKNANKK